MFQIIFGDDEHTAVDGPYSRLMKTRKWLYLTSAIALILSFRLYDEEAAGDILRVVELPWWLISQAALGGLIYLSMQYGLLVRQLLSSYDIILAERLAFRRAEDLAKAQERLDNQRRKVIDDYEAGIVAQRAEVTTLKSDRAALRSGRDKLLLDVKRLDNAYTAADWEKKRQSEEKLDEVERALQSVEQRVTRAENASEAPPPPDVDGNPEVMAARADLELLRSQNPADRGGYRQAEIAIDVARLVVPALSALGAAVSLALTIFQGQ